MREVVWVTTALLAIGAFGAGHTLGQWQRARWAIAPASIPKVDVAYTPDFSIVSPTITPLPGRSQLEELTGSPAAIVTPPKAPIDPNKIPPGWTVAAIKPGPAKVVLLYEPGGRILEHWERFTKMAARNDQVEVRGPCFSACTLVTAVMSRENICYGANSSLSFHLAQNPDGTPARDTSVALYHRYPADIRAWIDRKGGMEKMPFGQDYWVLYARELWAMGYQHCAD